MAEKEMTAKEFLKQYSQMCHSTSCAKCPLVYHNNIHDCGCETMLRDYPEDTLQIVQKWVEENHEKPKKTRLTEFLKLFPNAPLTEDGYPPECVFHYQRTDCQNNCAKCKAKFWNEEVKN